MAKKQTKVNASVPPGCSTGLVPRDYAAHPVGYYSFAPAMPDSELVDEAEWAERLADNRATKSGLRDLREANLDVLKSLDQDGLGLCWAFSSTKAVMYLRAVMNEMPVRLSAWWVAGVIKGWRDEGGWGASSLSKIVEAGVPSEFLCPAYKSSYNTPATQADAAKRKVTEWWDGSEDPNKAQKQLVSMLLKRVPCVVDLNDMGHSMCAIDIEKLSPLTILYDNSWGMNGDPDGYYRGTGARARPNGLVVPRVTMAS